MKRLSKPGQPTCFVISSGELKFGWSAEAQLAKNPEAKQEFPEQRKSAAAVKYGIRVRQWVLRAKKRQNPEFLKLAAWAMEKQLVLLGIRTYEKVNPESLANME